MKSVYHDISFTTLLSVFIREMIPFMAELFRSVNYRNLPDVLTNDIGYVDP